LVHTNADGSRFVNMYIQNSVSAYFATGDSNLLVKPVVKNLAPERLNSFEFGYRTFLFDQLETDINYYFSHYQNLIITQQFIGASNQIDTVNATYIKDPRKTLIYRMPVNSQVPAEAFGISFVLNYYLSRKLTIIGNYNYNQMIENASFLQQDFIAAFNTPHHKFNIGVNGVKINKYFGFSSNLRWVDQVNFKEYNKEGIVSSYYNIDLMISYTLPKYKTMFKIGGSNITNQRYTQSLGAPTIGAMYYFSILFDELLR
jgi:outer membrane receptor protein involved in Fe transport